MTKSSDAKKSDEDSKPGTDAPLPIIRKKSSEFEVQGMNLEDLLDKDFVEKLTAAFGEVGLVGLGILLIDKKDYITFTHSTFDDYKTNVLSIEMSDDESMSILAGVLGVSEE